MTHLLCILLLYITKRERQSYHEPQKTFLLYQCCFLCTTKTRVLWYLLYDSEQKINDVFTKKKKNRNINKKNL